MSDKKILQVGSKTIIGMVHCLPLPGTAGFDGDYAKIIKRAVEDALTLEKAGVDAVIVENMGDTPFSALLDIAQIASLSAAAMAVRQAVKLPIGIDAAFNDCKTSLAIAGIVGAEFVRIPVFVDTVLFTDGVIKPCARECMIYRKQMGLMQVKILADVQVKHAHMLLSDITVEQSAKDAEANGADGIIVTGSAVGIETPLAMIDKVKKVVQVPVFAGSGIQASNIKAQMEIADGGIIGSSLKKDGILTNPIAYELVRDVMDGLN
ncbi:MAG: BtpA/SgcQ family protein [Lachnospiraceae bacterium]